MKICGKHPKSDTAHQTLQTGINQPAVQTTDEVPADVRDFIIQNFPKL